MEAGEIGSYNQIGRTDLGATLKIRHSGALVGTELPWQIGTTTGLPRVAVELCTPQVGSGPHPPQSASAGHGSYRGISYRQGRRSAGLAAPLPAVTGRPWGHLGIVCSSQQNAGLLNSRKGEEQIRPMPSLTGFLITFCIGVAATLAWQSYGDAAREMIASSYPQLGWLAPQAAPGAQNASDMIAPAAPAAPPPDQQQLNAMSLDLDAVRQSIDRIATSIAASQEQITRSVDRIAASITTSQEQIMHSIERLTAGQEQMTREITKLQEIEQYILYKNSESPPPPAPARTRAPRPLQAPATPTPARNP